jgi:hypothetical protein
LVAILQSFGEVTGLCTNFQKSSVVPIRCGHFDLDAILEGIPASHTTFLMKYLGLPLSVWQLNVQGSFLCEMVTSSPFPAI